MGSKRVSADSFCNRVWRSIEPCVSANMYLHAEFSRTKWLKAMIVADHLSNQLCIPRVLENFKTADEASLGSTREEKQELHSLQGRLLLLSESWHWQHHRS